LILFLNAEKKYNIPLLSLHTEKKITERTSMKKRSYYLRYIALAAFFLTVCAIYIARLISIQIAGQDYYIETADTTTVTRTVTIKAQRGEIFDRNGVPLVTNSYTYNVMLDAATMPSKSADKNELLLKLVSSATSMNADCFTTPDIPFTFDSDGSAAFDEDYMATVYGTRLTRLLDDMNLGEDYTADDAYSALLQRYTLIEVTTDKDTKETTVTKLYGDDEISLLFALRIDMELRNFSTSEPYTVLKDVDMKCISMLREDISRGITVTAIASRVYEQPGWASHILGRTGRIQASQVDYYTELGYPLDAVVGITGAEQAFEEYLRGVDGELTIVEDEYGNVIDQYVSKEPVPGSDVYLTIDIEMQKVAETALKNNIETIVANALESGEALTGEDANAGALSVLNTDNGEVMALASYPTYDLSTFAENYQELNEDPLSPLFNRALEGCYPPGSTFKIGVATAALMENIITPYTEIVDRGIYEYYSDYQPRCWIYLSYHQTHGSVNVTKAIQESCNYFFYDVGRQLTIEKMNEYGKHFGLGEPTGIELSEKTGVLAGRDYREENGLDAWSLGDTLQAAIGQSDNVFTPLQLSVYISTIINGGTRYNAHILYQVKEFGTDNVIYEPGTTVADSIEIPDSVRSVIMNAMKNVTENGSASRLFRDYDIVVGGKTGTAQISSTKSDNAVFTAFAPFDDPQLVASCVIEQGSSGTDAGLAVKDIFDYYFGIGSYAENTTDDGSTDDSGTEDGGTEDGSDGNLQ
jgi:penicillin-binding protein 2